MRSKNKGADQLRGYREADLRLCFHICKKLFSHDEAHLSTFGCQHLKQIYQNTWHYICDIISDVLVISVTK